jgi:uncharacterized CHY-type Zn-finger protein
MAAIVARVRDGNFDVADAHPQNNNKENAMDEKKKFECGICYYQGMAQEFTPITVSANFAALECPKCLNNCIDVFKEIKEGAKKIPSAGVTFQQGGTTHYLPKKESAMNEEAIVECGVCYFHGTAKEFTPKTVSANLAAPECPKCLNNDAEYFEEIKVAEKVKAA